MQGPLNVAGLSADPVSVPGKSDWKDLLSEVDHLLWSTARSYRCSSVVDSCCKRIARACFPFSDLL
jgi:hypothetical protein